MDHEIDSDDLEQLAQRKHQSHILRGNVLVMKVRLKIVFWGFHLHKNILMSFQK